MEANWYRSSATAAFLLILGAAAHAGIRPEQGRSAILAAARAIAAMRVGRLDERTTVNVGTIAGGSAMNVVPERCSVLAEVRSLDEAKLLTPQRSEGGHRRYSRYQLRIAARARELVDHGTALDAACRIIILEDQLAEAHAINAELHRSLDSRRTPSTDDARSTNDAPGSSS